MSTDEYAGIDPENPDALTEDPNKPKYGEEEGGIGELLTVQPSECARKLNEIWKQQTPYLSKYRAQCRVNEMRREGYANATLEKLEGRDEYIAWSYGQQIPATNKAARLCRRLASTMYVDPPAPEPIPNGADPVHRDQAQFAGRVLWDVQSESQLNDIAQHRRAFDKASTYKRAFIWYRVNPHGDREPLQVEAHPAAMTVQAPFEGTDPMTGMPVPLPAHEKTLRFVGPMGELTDDQTKAAVGWVPKLESEVLTGLQVRYVPATATDLWSAEGVLIGAFVPLATLKKQFPEQFKTLTPDQIEAVKQIRPADAWTLAPGSTKKSRYAALALRGDDCLIWTLQCHMKQCFAYEQGAHLIAMGDDILLHRGPWKAQVQGIDETLDIPLTEIRQFEEGRDEPDGLMDIVGPGNEVLMATIGAALEYLDRVNSRKTILPGNSMITPSELQDPSRQILYCNPGGEPTFETIAPFDKVAMEMTNFADAAMDADSGVTSPEGLADPKAGSGRQAFAIISQGHVALAEPKQHAERAYIRGCRIQLQLIRAFFTKPQRLRWATPGGAYMEKRWTGADLGSTRDVKIKAGTMSMLAPAAKMEQAIQLGQLAVAGQPILSYAELREIISGNMEVMTGLKENPYTLRIRGQLAAWSDGPPEGWQPQPPMAMRGVGPMGEPVIQQVQAPDPVLSKMWEPVPSDELPEAAMIRAQEIGKTMASPTYQRWPVEWRMPLDQEFVRMRQMAGLQTVPEQQAAMQQQAMMEQGQGEQDHQRGMEADANREAAKAQSAAEGRAA
jgi:hypothetical protein